MSDGDAFASELLEDVRRVARELHVPIEQLSRREYIRRGAHSPRAVKSQWGAVRAAAACHADGRWEVPAGHSVRGVSALVGADGSVRAQWVKTRAAVDVDELVRRIGERLRDEVTQRTVRVDAPAERDGWDDILAVYPMGDPHIGLYAAARETGADWDIARATRVFRAAIDDLSARGTPAATALLVDLGDGLHADREGVTTKGTPLDTDGRWWEAVLAAVEMRVYQIDRLLEAHRDVIVWQVAGNHDRHSAFALSLTLAHHYRHEPRVSVPVDPSPFRFHRHGAVLLGATHGDTVSPRQSQRLALIMAERRARDWGETRHRRWLVGHVHHRTVRDEIGCEIETFRTLARPDAWHAREGYISQRDMRRIAFHRQWGEVGVDIIGGFALERFER